MALIKTESGCKVGWATYDSYEEAVARSKREEELIPGRLAAGYDFGYCWPGTIDAHEIERNGLHLKVWTVTTT